jgi:hypothetical protein
MQRILIALFVGLVSLMPVTLSAQPKFSQEIQPRDALDKRIPFHPLYRPREHFQNQRYLPERPPRVFMPPPQLRAFKEDPNKLLREWEKRKDAEAYERAIEDALQIPDENAVVDVNHAPFASITTWAQIGNGVNYYDGHHKAGRLRWAEYMYDQSQDATILYVSGSSGGLWKPVFIVFFAVWVPIGDNLPGSPSVGAFQAHPGDSRKILVGTGDSNRYPGTGIYQTMDEGGTWKRCPLSPTPNNVFRLQRDRNDASGNTYLAATANGIWRTTNFGNSWTRLYSDRATTDLIQDPTYPRYWYAGAQGLGILESNDYGLSFHPINGTGRVGITGDIAAVNLTLCNSAPNYVYAMIENNGGLNGVYRSSNYGYNWTKITSGDPFSAGQGFHARAIAVNPSNPAHVIAGMAWCNETTSATSSIVTWADRGIGHADFTRFLFTPSGTDIICCNDGGYYAYNIADHSINALGNTFGLNCQLVGRMEGARTSSTRLLSGLQDIGVIRTDSALNPANATPGSSGAFTADGGSVSFSPDTVDRMTWTNGAYGGVYNFRRFLSLNGGTNVTDVTGDGIIEEGDWNNTVMFDPVPGLGAESYLYAHSNQYLYWRRPASGNWQRINNGFPLPRHAVGDRQLGIKKFDVVNNPNVYGFYAARWGDDDLFVFEGSNIGSMNYVVRTPPLPADSTRTDCWFSADRSSLQPNTVYYTTGGARPSRAYVSFNRGQTWNDVTGDLTSNLPTANYYELIANPANTNQLFLGTNVGLFRSDNFGQNWYRYMNGLPTITDVPNLRIAYDGVTTPLIQIGTWGRGWWERNLPPTPTRSFAGTVSLENVFPAGVNVTFEFRPTDGSERFTRVKRPNAQGAFSLDSLPPGSYNVWIKMRRALAKVVSVNLTSGNVLNVSITLKGGDVNDDNSVDVLDLDLFIQAFDTCQGDTGYRPTADFNLDDCVDVLDLDILLRNFDQAGEA